MKRNSWLWLAAVGLLVVTLACGGGGGATPAPTKDTPPVASDEFKLTIDNQTNAEICYVLISSSTDSAWGGDWLSDNESIAAGKTWSVNLPTDTYDVMVLNCDQATMGSAWNIDATYRFTVGGKGLVGLEVLNESSVEICYTYIAPASDDSWGEDWMGESESIKPDGGRRIFYVQPGDYDLLVQDCDGNDLVQEDGVTLDSDTTWTVSD